MRVKETRSTPYGLKRRRYTRIGQDDLTTYEIPESVARSIGLRTVERWMRVWRKGESLRQTAAYRKEFVRQRMDWKPTAIAHDLGVSEARVRQMIKDINEEQSTSPRDSRGDARRTPLREVD